MPAQWAVETTSPDGQYRVRFSGRTSLPVRSYYPHGDHKVTYSVIKEGKSMLTDVPLYRGQQYDDLFLDLFPIQKWISNSVLRLGEKTTEVTGFDRILITNTSAKSIDSLRINFGVSDIFLVFELAANESFEVYAKPQTDKESDISGIQCFAMVGGNTIQQSAGFNIHGKYKGPATYHVDIGDSDIKIKSDQFEPVK